MLREVICDYIKDTLSEKRYIHSLGVAEEAKKLALKFDYDVDKAYLAGLSHDLAKEMSSEKIKEKLLKYGKTELFEEYDSSLIHGPVAAVILNNEFSVKDEEILDAVHYHTTGKENMRLLTKIIYLADFIEPNRKFVGVDEVRKIAENNLDEAIIVSSGMVIIHTVRNGKKIHPDTIMARNCLIEGFKSVKVNF